MAVTVFSALDAETRRVTAARFCHCSKREEVAVIGAEGLRKLAGALVVGGRYGG